MSIFISIVSCLFIFVIGLSFLERCFGLKEERNFLSKSVYLFYKASFFSIFLIIWFIFFYVSANIIWKIFGRIQNQNLKFYLVFSVIPCLCLRGKNLVYFVVKITLYNSFYQHVSWIKKSNEILLHLYRFIIFLISLIILVVSNVFSFLKSDNQFQIFTDNIIALNLAFATVLGFDAMCEATYDFYKQLKTLWSKKQK